MPPDGLTLFGARAFAGIVMTKVEFRVYSETVLEYFNNRHTKEHDGR